MAGHPDTLHIMASNDNSDKKGDKFEGRLVGETVKGMFQTHNRALPTNASAVKGQKKTREELEFSLAIILAEVASSDQNFEQREYTIIAESMKNIFGTSQAEAYNFIERARGILQNMRGASTYAEILKNSLNQDQLRQIMTSIENVACKDEQPTGFEIYLRDKYSKIFGLFTAE